MNCIVVDIGNTSTSIALSRRGRISRVSRLPGDLRDAATITRVVAKTGAGVALQGAILSSVVPRLRPLWLRCLRRGAGVTPLVMHAELELGIRLHYPKPATVGTDRLADAAGAVARFGAPVIVADFGTALTFNVVDARGAFIGGVIAPGLPLMTDYLAEKTAQLPRIALGGACGSLGRSTREAMRIGARVGYRGMVREITQHLQEGLGLQRARLCATGGYARWALADADMPFVIEPNLTLFGLSRVFALNLPA